ncbi:DUF6431 domain-containing protein [Paenibacillus durus]|uniref:DUF6431 domain-containing protein n=1 Tax=Paenibacillus durus TaxID=44251 RepID=UPI000693A077|nr:DUF6431 domain-containing protein [Paenibacillus durus]
MKRSLVFFVRGAEEVPCPCCTENLEIIGSRERKVRGGGGELRQLVIRRLRCAGCRRIHHELPDLLIPYKRYDSRCIEQAVTEPEASVTACAETSTLRRWKVWFRVLSIYFILVLQALEARMSGLAPGSPEASDHLRMTSAPAFRQQGPGWLARLVRPVANAHLWVHTRFAYLSAPALR